MYIELIRLFKNRNFYISILGLLLIVLMSVITGVRNFNENYNLYQSLFKNNKEVLVFVSPYKEWVGLSISNVFSSLYYFLFPLLISISLTDSIYIDKNTGNINYSLMRMSKVSYFSKKFLFTYIISFLLFVLPLAIGILLINILAGHWDYSNYTNFYKEMLEGTVSLPDDTFIGDKKDLFSDLLAKSPYLYIAVYYLLGGLFASGYICIGLAFSLINNNRYLIIFFPQIVYIGSWLIFTVVGKLSWDPFNFLDPKQPVEGLSYTIIIYVYFIQLIIALIMYLYGVKKNRDVFS
ncbi:NADH dehydrogenase [Bacillus rubiinfantis]|uniref:NADH dehydrogenase n=1 Tax=Bacillus rubiinfantis TaxID=1499680 RepID=UPI0005A8E3E7|nr:NADH dehydrogenase [Bacillus rubiinfantis]